MPRSQEAEKPRSQPAKSRGGPGSQEARRPRSLEAKEPSKCAAFFDPFYFFIDPFLLFC